MKATSEILLKLKSFKPRAERLYGFTRLGVFGSVARGEQTEDSDVDICYESEPLSLFTQELVQQDLERLLGMSVDLVRIRTHMNQGLRKRIQKEGIYV